VFTAFDIPTITIVGTYIARTSYQQGCQHNPHMCHTHNHTTNRQSSSHLNQLLCTLESYQPLFPRQLKASKTPQEKMSSASQGKKPSTLMPESSGIKPQGKKRSKDLVFVMATRQERKVEKKKELNSRLSYPSIHFPLTERLRTRIEKIPATTTHRQREKRGL
jgi:hypothetical protein